MNDQEVFECETYHLTMPKEKQQGFCALRNRKAEDSDYCRICPIGITAAKKEPFLAYDNKLVVKKENEMPNTDGKVVASKVCTDCRREYKPTSNVQKRCPECKAKKKPSAKKKAISGKRTQPQSKHNGNGHTCTDCAAEKTINILISAGIIDEGKVDAARALVG